MRTKNTKALVALEPVKLTSSDWPDDDRGRDGEVAGPSAVR